MSSSRDSAMWWASSRATPSREGIPITVRPAARAAATPVGESSRATTSGPGSTPSATAGLEVGVGRGLRRRGFVGADDDVEGVLEGDDLQRAADELDRRVRDQADRGAAAAQRRQQIAGADHRLHAMLELGDHQLVQLLDQLRRPARLLEAPLEDPPGDLGRGADQLHLVGGRELHPPPLEEVLLGPRPDRLGVEQQAVVVENHGVGPRRLHVREHRVARWLSTSRSACRCATPASSISTGRTCVAKVVEPWLENRTIEMGDREWLPEESSLKILEGPHMDPPDLSFGQGWSNAERKSEVVTREMIEDGTGAAGVPDAFLVETDSPEAFTAEVVSGHGGRADRLERGEAEARRPRLGGRGRHPRHSEAGCSRPPDSQPPQTES